MENSTYVGRVFGRLSVLSVFRRGKKTILSCLCSCGSAREARADHVVSGKITSCGCWRAERSSYLNKTHGRTKTTEYVSWMHMLSRCMNESSADYKDYGGRGISVCLRWMEFALFLEDMGDKPSPSHSIDRINNDGNYEPSNCRWATPKEQASNKRNTRQITAFNQTKSLTDWAEERKIPVDTIRARIDKLGYEPERALTVAKYTKNKPLAADWGL